MRPDRWLVVAAVICLAVLAVYGPSTRHGFVDYDTETYLSRNLEVRAGLTLGSVRWAFTTFHGSNWHPLTWLSHMLDVQLFGMRPGWLHLVNVLFHALNTLLLLAALAVLTGAFWRSALVAALFALHPLHVESVAWVAERKDMLVGLGWMLTLIGYVRYVRKPGIARYVAVVTLYALTLLAKPMGVTLPFVLLLLDVWPLGRLRGPTDVRVGGRWRQARLLLEKLPLFLMAAASCVVTWLAQASAMSSLAGLSLADRIANALVSYTAYLGQTVWPHGLAIFYPFPPRIPFGAVAGAVLLLTAGTVLAVRARRARPWLPMGWFWYLGTLVPVIGLIQVGGQARADRYTYLPLVGVFVLLAWGLGEAAGSSRTCRAAAGAVSLAVLLALLTLARTQVGAWRDDETLFGHALAVTRENYVAADSLAMALQQRGDLPRATALFREALRIRPYDAKIRTNLGVALAKQGKLDEAIFQWRRAIALQPAYAKAYNNLGIALAWLNRSSEAEANFREALRLEPRYAEAWQNLGTLHEETGRENEALQEYSRALALEPAYAVASNGLGSVLQRKGRVEESILRFQEAVRLDPGFAAAHFNLAKALQQVGRVEEAQTHFRLARRLGMESARNSPR